MDCILTEKPSVALDFAKSFATFTRHDGYIESEGYYITWAIGHLVKISDSVAPKKWDIESLPIFPSSFTYDVIQGKEKQLKTIKEILGKSDNVIIATDAGREGELIARLILIDYGWKDWSRVKRFWTSEAITPEIVKEQLRNLKPSGSYIKHFYQAYARQHADWLVGINASRYITCRAGNLWTVGRVQTPTVNLIATRCKEHFEFKKVQYSIVRAEHIKDEITFYSYLITAQDEKLAKEKATGIVDELKKQSVAHVNLIETKDRSVKPPLLHSISTLQVEANRVYNFKAQKTLDIAQALYEVHKCLSYPRTDSEYLGESNISLVKEIVGHFVGDTNYGKYIPVVAGNVDRVGKRVFDNTKLTDHHALIPLKPAPNHLNQDEQKLFSLVANRFIGVFMEDYKYTAIKIKMDIGKYEFLSLGKKPIAQGWTVLYEIEKDEAEQELPRIVENELIKIKAIEGIETETKPPALLTEGSLVALMKKFGLGTQATRASIIEKIIQNGYVTSKKNYIISTQKGEELLKNLSENEIISPELTGLWERKLDEVYSKENYISFMGQTKEFVKEVIGNLTGKDIKQVVTVKQLEFAQTLAKTKKSQLDAERLNDPKYIESFITQNLQKQVELGQCQCGGEIQEMAKSYNCKKCGLLVWKVIFTKKIKEGQAIELLKGNTILVKGLKGKSGSKFDAHLQLEGEKGKVKLIFE